MVFSTLELQTLKLLTIQQQRVLIKCYQDKGVSFETQPFYKNIRCFELAMQELVHANILAETGILEDDKFKKTWRLTLNGVLLVEEVLLDFIRCNDVRLQARTSNNTRGVSPYVANRD